MTILNPYLSFRDTARQAMEFYQSVFGGELVLDTIGENHASEDPADFDKIMHAQLTTPGGLTLMGADTPNAMPYSPGGSVSVSLSGDDVDELRGYWDRLSEGGELIVPFEMAPWGAWFGMTYDPFGVQWLVNATPPSA